MSGDAPLELLIREVVMVAEASSARTLQKAIGPSEIGDPCDRAIAYKLAGVEPTNTDRDNWLATLGTAGHAWLADAFQLANDRAGYERFLIEQRVNADGIEGTSDLFDTLTGTVIDHKILGVTSLRKIASGDIPPKYHVQLHTYGLGITRLGYQVNSVALAAYPRSDNLRGDFSGKGLHVHVEPWQPLIAHAARRRVEAIGKAVAVVPPGVLPARPSDDCRYCPFFRPGQPADAAGCPGAPVEAAAASIPGIC